MAETVYSRSDLKGMFLGGTSATQEKFENLLNSVYTRDEFPVGYSNFVKLTAPDVLCGDPSLGGTDSLSMSSDSPGATNYHFGNLNLEWTTIFSNSFMENAQPGATLQINQPGYYRVNCSVRFDSVIGVATGDDMNLVLFGTSIGPTAAVDDSSGFQILSLLDMIRKTQGATSDGYFGGRIAGDDIILIEDVPYYLIVQLNMTGSQIQLDHSRLTVTKIADLA
jgi:hypothetical protein